MEDIVIEVDGLTKEYKLYEKKSDRVLETLSFAKKKYYKPFYALNGISFRVMRGETVGIIGTNGSGKSTLLKILTGVVAPSGGTFTVKGKISALLELGAGFNPEYTGLQNIDLHGTMMGYTESEMSWRREEIIKFADIGDYINQPVKNYSSGMFARLAFAVAISVEPEILIVDEALSVGDMRFQIKCMDRMKEMMENGTTILFVSHDISSVRRFCKRCIWIDRGILKEIGEANVVADMYSDFLRGGEQQIGKVSGEKTEQTGKTLPDFNPGDGSRIAEIIDFEILAEQGRSERLRYDESIEVRVTYDVYDDSIDDPVLGVAVFSIDDRYICGLNTLLDHRSIPWKIGRNHFSLQYPQGLRVLGGKYYFDTAIRDKTATVNIDYKKCVREIQVYDGYAAEGLMSIPHVWKK